MSLLGETVKIRREELGLDQATVAQEIGVSQQTVSRWEKGFGMPRPGRVIALARLLELDLAHLQRLAGYLPAEETSDVAPEWRTLYDQMHHLTRTELMLLIDRAWQELRRREDLTPPGTT